MIQCILYMYHSDVSVSKKKHLTVIVVSLYGSVHLPLSSLYTPCVRVHYNVLLHKALVCFRALIVVVFEEALTDYLHNMLIVQMKHLL